MFPMFTLPYRPGFSIPESSVPVLAWGFFHKLRPGCQRPGPAACAIHGCSVVGLIDALVPHDGLSQRRMNLLGRHGRRGGMPQRGENSDCCHKPDSSFVLYNRMPGTNGESLRQSGIVSLWGIMVSDLKMPGQENQKMSQNALRNGASVGILSQFVREFRRGAGNWVSKPDCLSAEGERPRLPLD
jgi:hypothetical protein